jgi:iron complex outermembrane receptor protein
MSTIQSTFSYTKALFASVLILFGVSSVGAQELEEIIVTAQKREENLQDVPVAVSAYTGDYMTENSVKDVFELMTSVPSLIVGANQSSSTGNFSIRGVGTSAQNWGLESSVGLYVDGIYRARQSSMINQLVDVQAVEVLRGPQGTLFGKNSASGAVLLRTVAPSHNQDGFLEVSFGEYDLMNLSGAFNMSLSENLAARTTVFSSQRDGFIEVVNLDGQMNDRNRQGVRQQFLYTPSDTLSVRVIADYSTLDEVCCAALAHKDGLVASGRLDPETGGPVYGPDAILAQLGGTTYLTGSASNRQVSLNALPDSSATDSGISVEITKDLATSTFTSITALRNFDVNDFTDTDFTNVDLGQRVSASEQSAITQEFRIASNLDGPMQYQVGAFLFSQDLSSTEDLTLGTMLNSYAIAASPDVLGALLETMSPELIGFINGAYGTAFGTTLAAPIAAGNIIQDRGEQSQTSTAIFGEIDYALTDVLTLNAGIRFTAENKELSSTFSESLATPGLADVNLDAITAALGIAGNQALAYGYGVCYATATGGGMDAATADAYCQGAGYVYDSTLAAMDASTYVPALNVLYASGWANCSLSARLCPRAAINEEIDEKRVTGNIGLSFTPDENTLIYASYGTGFKSGGTNTDRIGVGFDPVFGPEDTSTYEIGLKRDFPEQGLRVNFAYYDMLVEDLQTNTFTGTAFNLQNAGEVNVNGIEAEVFFFPSDTSSITLAYTSTNATFDNFERGNCQISNIFHTGNTLEATQQATQGYCDRSGNRVSNVSDEYYSINAAKTFEFNSGYALTLGAQFISYSDMMMHNNNDPFALQPAKDMLNIRAVSRMPNGMEVVVWARNLNDTYLHGTVFDTPLQDGKLGHYPMEPKTYGVSIRRNF